MTITAGLARNHLLIIVLLLLLLTLVLAGWYGWQRGC